jgi:hypothetical protein
MSSKPLEVRLPITDALVEKKLKQTYLNDTPNQCHYPSITYPNHTPSVLTFGTQFLYKPLVKMSDLSFDY